MVRQQVHAVAAGYEDLNDHDALHHDEVVQTACEQDESLAGSSTLWMENRTSSPRWWTNQYRVALAALAYTLLETMRRTVLRGTALARAQCRALRLRLLKLGAVVTRNTHTVAVRLSSTCPDQAVFRLLVHRLTAG